MFKSKTKVLIALFDVYGIFHEQFLSQDQTINQHVYKYILQRLMLSVREKRRELWETRSWLLHHDNAPAHNALGIREFLAKNNIAVLEQPPYSSDLAPCDFFFVSQTQGSHQRNLFSRFRSHKNSRDEGALSNLGGILPGVRGSVAEEIGKAHSSLRRLL